jgi:hypothetical protein
MAIMSRYGPCKYPSLYRQLTRPQGSYVCYSSTFFHAYLSVAHPMAGCHAIKLKGSWSVHAAHLDQPEGKRWFVKECARAGALSDCLSFSCLKNCVPVSAALWLFSLATRYHAIIEERQLSKCEGCPPLLCCLPMLLFLLAYRGKYFIIMAA